MQNYKIETNSELIYEDGTFWSTLIFIKTIGSDTLWFPLPPSEVLQIFLKYHLRKCTLLSLQELKSQDIVSISTLSALILTYV